MLAGVVWGVQGSFPKGAVAWTKGFTARSGSGRLVWEQEAASSNAVTTASIHLVQTMLENSGILIMAAICMPDQPTVPRSIWQSSAVSSQRVSRI